MVTVDTILLAMKEWVEGRKPIPPSMWLDAAAKLNVLQQDEEDKKIEYEVNYNIVIKELMENGATHAKAQVFAKTTEEYKLSRKQEARCRIITEFVRISKLRARIQSDQEKL